MPLLIVSYELEQPRKHFVDLIPALKSYELSAQILDSTWAVVSGKTAAEIRGELWNLLDPDDGIFVLESGREAAWQDVRCENQWLREHL